MTRMFVSLLALVAATPALALSDQPPAPAETAETAAAPTGDVVVTASRSGDAIPTDLIGSSVTVLDSDALAQRQTRMVSDILRDVPGVAVSRSGAIGGTTQVRIRGSESNHVLVFVDGIKASDPYYSEFDFAGLVADENARIEVLRGQQSALYGSDAIGGVISYATLTGREAPGITTRAEGGSQGTFSTAARAGGVAGDNVDYAVSAAYLTTKGYPAAPGGSRDLGADNLGVSVKTNWTPSPVFKLTAVGRYNYTRADTDDQAIAPNSPMVLGYPVITLVDTPGSYYKNSAYYGLVSAELNLFDGAWSNMLSGQITDATRDGYTSAGYSYGDRGRRYRAAFNSTVRFGNEHVRNRFTYAVDFEREQARVIDPSGYAFTGTNRSDTTGFVAEYELTVDQRLSLGASARIDQYSRFKGAETYRATASYLLPTGTRLHAAYGTGIKAPTLTELFGYSTGQYIGNPNLQPERSKGWEAGVEQIFAGGNAKIGATYFDNRFEDEIQTVYVFANGQYVTSSANSATSTSQKGVELYANIKLKDWRVDAAYTYLDAPQSVLAVASPAPADGSYQAPVPVITQAVRRPKNSASLNVSYIPDALPLSVTATLRYNGAMRDYAFSSSYQTLLVDLHDYVLVNLNASYDLTKRVQIFGRVENLLNRKYQEVFTYRAPGTTAYGGVRIKL
ncbi:TonB-dependent receptor [Sphingomonas sp. MMSM24]|uniref:TonB-dependent receptor n=2 Tax=Sphingomonas lycopersici TaxID=2951807 RepID=A0AA42CP46_9SPHN|nr:TonB-dependent receptor [Sphingomonas lycopersici]